MCEGNEIFEDSRGNKKELNIFDPIRFAAAQEMTELHNLRGVIKVYSMLCVWMRPKRYLYLFPVWHSYLYPKKGLSKDISMPQGWLFRFKETVGKRLPISVAVGIRDHSGEEVFE